MVFRLPRSVVKLVAVLLALFCLGFGCRSYHQNLTDREAFRRLVEAAQTWPSTQGTITISGVHGGSKGGWFPNVRYQFYLKSKPYGSSRIYFQERRYRNSEEPATVARKYPVGSSVTVYYDPQEPNNAVLDRTPVAPRPKYLAWLYVFGGLLVGLEFLFLLWPPRFDSSLPLLLDGKPLDPDEPWRSGQLLSQGEISLPVGTGKMSLYRFLGAPTTTSPSLRTFEAYNLMVVWEERNKCSVSFQLSRPTQVESPAVTKNVGDYTDESLPVRPAESQYRVERVADGLEIQYQASFVVLLLFAIGMITFMAGVGIVASLKVSPAATERLLFWVLGLCAAPVPFVAGLGFWNFSRSLTLLDTSEVRLGSLQCPAREVRRKGWSLKVAGTFIFLPLFRKDLDWLTSAIQALAERSPTAPPLGLPPTGARDPKESQSSGMLYLALLTLLGGAGWTVYLFGQSGGVPSIAGLSELFTWWLIIGLGLLLVCLTGRNTLTLSTFVLGLLCFAWGANFQYDPQAQQQDFLVLASFSTGDERSDRKSHFLELDVPPELEAFRFISAPRAAIDMVPLRYGPGAVGQAWVINLADWGHDSSHFGELGKVPIGQDLLEEVHQRKGPMIIEGEFRDGSRALAQFQAWGAVIRAPKPAKTP